jgi:hypothetical protein
MAIVTVLRSDFMHWLEGDLMELKGGRGYAVNELDCEAAETAIVAGTTVFLKDSGGRIVSKMCLSDAGVPTELVLTDSDRAFLYRELVG